MTDNEKMYDPDDPADRAKLAEKVREGTVPGKLGEAVDNTTPTGGGQGNEADSTSNET
jgi:hypothetical protein